MDFRLPLTNRGVLRTWRGQKRFRLSRSPHCNWYKSCQFEEGQAQRYREAGDGRCLRISLRTDSERLGHARIRPSRSGSIALESSASALHFTLPSTANAAFPEDIGDSSNPVSPTRFSFFRGPSGRSLAATVINTLYESPVEEQLAGSNLAVSCRELTARRSYVF